MSANSWIALLLDAPLQSWGQASRFERRTTELHPTRSAIIGLLAAALGIDKFSQGESEALAKLTELEIISVTLPKRHGRTGVLPIRRLEDYHTISPRGGIRRASGKVDLNTTVQSYRHYLLDARFGVLLSGPVLTMQEIAGALMNPRWGLWYGRKCCLPATPILASLHQEQELAWAGLLKRAGLKGTESLDEFDYVQGCTADTPGAEMVADDPLGFGLPIGQRHRPRWILRHVRTSVKDGA